MSVNIKQLKEQAVTEGQTAALEIIADVPLTLRDAIAELEASEGLKAAFGEGVVEHYLHAARWEQSELDRRVTDFELQRYFERS